MAARRTWDEFVARSRVAHFMFRRGYMEYHADRFCDHSLIIRENTRPLALLPASRACLEVTSHGGLTFGGFVTDRRMICGRMSRVVEHTVAHLRDQGIARMVYKPPPHIYQLVPADEDLYALSRCGAQLVRRRLTSVIALDSRPRPTKGRRHALARARRRGLSVHPSRDLHGYGRLLDDALARRGARPVHSADELELLASRHPANIRLFVATLDNATVAGVVVFETPRVVRTQYIAAGEQGLESGAVDAILAALIECYAGLGKRWLDLGTSTEPGSDALDAGLLRNKESYGARAVVQDATVVGSRPSWPACARGWTS